jgi:hypothetical protein
LKTGWNAGARSACDVAPTAPHRCRALGPHRPPSVRGHGVDHVSVIVAGPTALRLCARRRCGHASRPTHRGPAGQATWRAVRPPSLWPRFAPNAPGPSWPSHLACMRANRPARCPTHSSSLAFARTQLRATLRARCHRRSEHAGAPYCPPPLLEFKHHISLHPHPLDPPVHVHWPADPPACQHCGRSGRPPPSLSTDRRRSRSGRTDPTNRPRVSPNPTPAAHSPESSPSSPPAGLALPSGTSLQGLKSFQGPKHKNRGSNCKGNLKP